MPTEWLDHPILGAKFELPPSVLADSDIPNAKWSKARIEEFARAHDIDLTGATTKADMVAVIDAHVPPSPDPTQESAETPATGDEEN